MVRGLYTAYTGMVNQQKRLDTITNNLANASTTGYKREGATARAFDEVLGVRINDKTSAYQVTPVGNMSLGVKIGENYTDYSQGSLKNTENTYDLALEGNGFFSISFTNKQGEQSIKYTRDGNFTLDVDGGLRTTDGDYVQGEGGDIYIPTDAAKVAITITGDIYADGEYIDTIKIVDFENYDYIFSEGVPIQRIRTLIWDQCSFYESDTLTPILYDWKEEQVSRKVYIYKIKPKHKYRDVCG